MAVKPIIFSGPMVRALLAGKKTQTRRVLKSAIGTDFHREKDGRHYFGFSEPKEDGQCGVHYPCLPYATGDRLWVREAWRACAQMDQIKPSAMSPYEPRQMEADGALIEPACMMLAPGRYRHAQFMPKAFSRLTLEVTNVRVQRVQDISEEDVRAEGVRGNAGGEWGCEGLIEDFADLWDSLHGEGAWDRNDWVAAYTFTVHQANVDDLLRQREAA